MSLQDGEKNLYRQTTVGYWFCMFVTNSLSRRTLLQIHLRQGIEEIICTAANTDGGVCLLPMTHFLQNNWPTSFYQIVSGSGCKEYFAANSELPGTNERMCRRICSSKTSALARIPSTFPPRSFWQNTLTSPNTLCDMFVHQNLVCC